MELPEAMENLRQLVACRCDEAWTDRGRHDPQSACDWREEVDLVATSLARILEERDEARRARAPWYIALDLWTALGYDPQVFLDTDDSVWRDTWPRLLSDVRALREAT